jgi:glycosyltransferase involved in cell wall biosynthesis
MLEGQNIVCFAKDWKEDPTSNNHVMRLLAEKNRVLWVNSLGMRTPNLTSAADLTKIADKIKSFAQNAVRGAEQVGENFWVFTPVVLPLPHHPMAQALNRQILAATLGLMRRRLEMDPFILWTFLPTSVAYLGSLGESFVVYYITDEFSQFSYLDTDKIIAMEKKLCREADIVFCTAHSLLEAKKVYNPNSYLASHGVDYEHFSRALDPNLPIPDDIKDLPGPVVGFFGLIHDWIDIELIAFLARERPDWSFVVIGSAKVDVSILEAQKNIHLLGRRPYESLPAYCRGFSAALIPFAVNALTQHVNPIKLREYLSAGLPVVSTPLPEVLFYRDHCEIAGDHREFLKALDRAIQADSPARRKQRSQAMAGETWEHKVEILGADVARALAAKVGTRSRSE